jgi:hypothetical protein
MRPAGLPERRVHVGERQLRIAFFPRGREDVAFHSRENLALLRWQSVAFYLHGGEDVAIFSSGGEGRAGPFLRVRDRRSHGSRDSGDRSLLDAAGTQRGQAHQPGKDAG